MQHGNHLALCCCQGDPTAARVQAWRPITSLQALLYYKLHPLGTATQQPVIPPEVWMTYFLSGETLSDRTDPPPPLGYGLSLPDGRLIGPIGGLAYRL